jgi:Holliday junction resolvasome RuvABC endonuclease subunit
MQHATILALDVSSTTIGYCLYDGTVLAHGQILLKHNDVNHRARLARAQIAGLLIEHPGLDCVAIEAPGSPHKGALIPQCYVSGAIRALLTEYELLICDVAAQHAKQALTGKGNAKKQEMQAKAEVYGVRGEHAADALGVALACVGRVKVVPV